MMVPGVERLRSRLVERASTPLLQVLTHSLTPLSSTVEEEAPLPPIHYIDIFRRQFKPLKPTDQ